MSLIVRIKADQLTARKNKEAVRASLLTTLIGEAEMVGKNAGNRASTDDEVIAVIKKFIKNIDETLKVKHSDDLLLEKALLEIYLPKQMSAEEIHNVLTEYFRFEITDQITKGQMMKFLKENYAGKYDDGKLAAQVVDALTK